MYNKYIVYYQLSEVYMNNKFKLTIASILLITSCANIDSSNVLYLSSSISTSSVESSTNQQIENTPTSKFNFHEMKNYVMQNYYKPDSFSYYSEIYKQRIAGETIPEFLNSVDKIIVVPPLKEEGFELAYVLKFPSGKYTKVNEGVKRHLMLGNFDPNPSNEEFGFAMLTYTNQNVYDRTPQYHSPTAVTADRLDFPMLTPIVPWNCPGTDYDQAVNVHLDRDSVLASSENLSDYKKTWCGPGEVRLDKPFEPYETVSFVDLEKQVYNIIIHAQNLLKKFDYEVDDRVMFSGFSNVSIFAQRFSTVYPQIVKAYYAGAVVFPIVPGSNYKGKKLYYPVGIAENKELFGVDFDLEAYNNIAKLNIVGKYEYMVSYYDRFNFDLIRDLYVQENEFRFVDEKGVRSIDAYHNRVIDAFYELGGKGLFIINQETAHSMSDNDFEFSIDFFRMNAKSDTPIYPKNSPYPEHLIRLG